MPTLTRAELLELPPTVDLVTGGRALGIGKNRTYEMARSGSFPVKLLRVGKRYRVVTADLLDVLGLKAAC